RGHSARQHLVDLPRFSDPAVPESQPVRLWKGIRLLGERAAVGESRGFSGIEPCGPALRPEHIGRMRAKRQADGFAYAARIFFPSPSDPGMLPPMKHRSVRDAAFPGRCRARHGQNRRSRVNTSRYALIVMELRFRL